MPILKLVTFILLAFYLSDGYAARIYGAGQGQGCGVWLNAWAKKDYSREQAWEHLVLAAWIKGYVSGADGYGAPLKSVDSMAIDHWVTEYCRANQFSQLYEVGNALIKDLSRH